MQQEIKLEDPPKSAKIQPIWGKMMSFSGMVVLQTNCKKTKKLEQAIYITSFANTRRNCRRQKLERNVSLPAPWDGRINGVFVISDNLTFPWETCTLVLGRYILFSSKRLDFTNSDVLFSPSVPKLTPFPAL